NIHPISITQRFDLRTGDFQARIKRARLFAVAVLDAERPGDALRLADRLRELVEPTRPIERRGLVSGTMQILTPQALRTMHRQLPSGCHCLRNGCKNGLTFLHYARYCSTRSVCSRGEWTHERLSEQQPK